MYSCHSYIRQFVSSHHSEKKRQFAIKSLKLKEIYNPGTKIKLYAKHKDTVDTLSTLLVIGRVIKTLFFNHKNQIKSSINGN